VLLDIGLSTVGVEMHLPAAELSTALGLPGDTGATDLTNTHAGLVLPYLEQHFSLATDEGHRYLSDGIRLGVAQRMGSGWVTVRVNFTPPESASTRAFLINDDMIVAQVTTHNILVSVRNDFRNGIVDQGGPGAEPLLVGLLHYQQRQLRVESLGGGWFHGFIAVFGLGMEHISGGTDHVLFLLVLLLVAPLYAQHRRWNHVPAVGAILGNILKTVTGFTLGHSLTLVLGATGAIRFPSQPVEVLIALSIAVSALHGVRPLFPGREPWVAGFFGLIHGMAFASSLTGFGYDPWVLGLAIAGFNLGIEAMQLLVVLVVLPALVLWSATGWYGPLRVGTALLAGLLALGWAWERAFDGVSPLSAWANWASDHAVALIAALTLLGLAARALNWRRGRKASAARQEVQPRR